MTPYGHQAYACMHAVLGHNDLIVPRASYLAQCKRSTMCHSCSNSSFAVRAIRIALVFPPRDATKHCVHLSCLLSPAWTRIGTTSARLQDHGAFRPLQHPSFITRTPYPSPTAIWCQDSSSAAPCTPCSRLFGRLSRSVDRSLLGLVKSCHL